jgi:hypothetical protein
VKLRIALCVVATAASTCLSAATVTFISGDGLNESNNQPGFTNILRDLHPAWQPNNPNGTNAKWITFTDGLTPPDVLNPITGPSAQPPTAIFYEVFQLPEMPSLGSIRVWADDTARVFLNGTLLIEANPTNDAYCTFGPIGCGSTNNANLDLMSALQIGTNTLQFDVYQRWGGPSGLLYEGSVTYQQTNNNAVPEPSTLAFVAPALLGTRFLLPLVPFRFFPGTR